MTESNLRGKILTKAVELFSVNGFHGTSIREIANAAECSLPMLYYYFKNKNELYEEIACTEFFRIHDRLNQELPVQEHALEIYCQYLHQRKNLPYYERAVYQLALRAWLGFEGQESVRQRLQEWEAFRSVNNTRILAKYCKNPEIAPVFSRIFIRTLENLLEKIILMNNDIPDAEIRAELEMLFDFAQNYAPTNE